MTALSTIASYSVIALETILVIEIAVRLPWAWYFDLLLSRLSDAIEAMMGEHPSDLDKERALRISALKLLLHTILGPLAPIGLLMLHLGLSALFEKVFHFEVHTPGPMLWMSIFGTGYVVGRGRIRTGPLPHNKTTPYGPTAQALHRFALSNRIVSQLCFNLEERFFGKKAESSPPHEPVWVCGLARGGTTLTTELLYATGVFHSLTYRHMPFVLSPNLWGKLARFNTLAAKGKVGRAHGDGILIDLESPEAFEEVFWRTHSLYYQNNPSVLPPHKPTMETTIKFRSFLASLQHQSASPSSEKRRYLAKNNSNLTRLPWLLDTFPTGKVVVPIRHPLQHAFSLWRQHQKWQIRHQDDDFSRAYMDWIGHYEFGAFHRPFSFTHVPILEDAQTFEYWVDRWIDAYSYLGDLQQERLIWLDFTQLSQEPARTLESLFCKLGVTLPVEAITRISKSVRKEVLWEVPQTQQSERALALYQKLVGKYCGLG